MTKFKPRDVEKVIYALTYWANEDLPIPDAGLTYFIERYFKDLNVWHQIEDRIIEKGWHHKYAYHMSCVTKRWKEPNYSAQGTEFPLIHASADQKLEACINMLKEMEEDERLYGSETELGAKVYD
jgi:hypothetical protein